MRLLFLIPLILPLVSCNINSGCEVKLVTVDKRIVSYVVNELKEANIRYGFYEPNGVCVPYESVDDVRYIFGDTVNKFITPYYSASYDPGLFELITTELDKKNIWYDSYMMQNTDWLVWQERDDEEVRGIIKRKQDQFVEEWLKE